MTTLSTTALRDRLQKAKRELRFAGERSESIVKQRAQPAVVRQVLAGAVQKVAPTVRQMVMRKFRASGIQSRTGKLAAAMAGVRLQLKWRGQKPIIQVAMPDGLGDDFYRRAASLNFGSVRQPRTRRIIVDLPSNNEKARTGTAGVIGERAKRTLKKQVVGRMGQSHRADTWRNKRTNRARSHQVSYDSRQAVRAGSSYRVAVEYRVFNQVAVGGNLQESSETKRGQFSVIPPKDWWYFSESEKATIAQMIEAEIISALEGRS
jgi:hypothetical protein